MQVTRKHSRANYGSLLLRNGEYYRYNAMTLEYYPLLKSYSIVQLVLGIK